MPVWPSCDLWLHAPAGAGWRGRSRRASWAAGTICGICAPAASVSFSLRNILKTALNCTIREARSFGFVAFSFGCHAAHDPVHIDLDSHLVHAGLITDEPALDTHLLAKYPC